MNKQKMMDGGDIPCMEYSYEKQDIKKKPKPVFVLQVIAWTYLLIAAVLFIVNVNGYQVTSIDKILLLGFLFACVQTYLIGSVIHAVYIYKDKHNQDQ